MLTRILKKYDPIVVDIYVDGRVYIPPQPGNLNHIKALIKTLEMNIEAGKIKNMQPGRYTYGVKSKGPFSAEFELLRIPE